jgi:hypothetical protein
MTHPRRSPLSLRHTAASALVLAGAALLSSVATGASLAVNVPASLQVPAGNSQYMATEAAGTQNYICLPTTTGVAWGFLGPQATLFNAQGHQIMTHFLSPNPLQAGAPRATWQHSHDTGTVWAAAIASYGESDYVEAGAVPWLLLEVVGAQAGVSRGDRISDTTYIQRVNTSGGVAPATGCSAAGDIGKRVMVPYTTTYVFYRAR